MFYGGDVVLACYSTKFLM